MKMRMWLPLLIAMLTAGNLMNAQSQVKCIRVPYHGWNDAVQMSNGTVELVFVPQIGRVMRYALVGGPNVLWNNPALYGKTTDIANPPKDWINYGGDKLWPSPQSEWGWPPDPIMDSGEQLVTITPDNHLIVEGHTSAKHGIRFLREISLDDIGTGVTFKNTMVNARPRQQIPDPKDPQNPAANLSPVYNRVTWGIWEVAQMDNPTEARLLIHKKGHFPQGYYTFKDQDPAGAAADVTPTLVRLRRDPNKSCKIGGDAPQGYLEAVVHDVTFRISARVEAGQKYPDDGCAQEIWTNPDPLAYVELEMLGPIHTLEPGKSAVFTTRWSLTGK